MPQQTDLEKDPFLVLLTDALRAGPGSPEWRDAVAKLKSAGPDVDEYRLLIDAREALENGKDYRSVRAGAGFTRKLLTNLEADRSAGRRAFPLTGLIAVLAGLVLAGAIGLAIFELYPRAPVNPAGRSTVEELANTYLRTMAISTDFQTGIPDGWRKIGSLPLETGKGGLRAGAVVVTDGGYVGGGLVLDKPLPADQPFSISVTLAIQNPGEALIPQVFVANSPDFSSDRAIAAEELVWEMQGAEQKVVVGGRVEKQDKAHSRLQTQTIRIVLNQDLAIVESNQERLWSGPNTLGNQPRYVGIRFIRTAQDAKGDVSIETARVQK